MRAEFSNGVRTTIAGRAGYRCSYPDCGKVTIGPGAGPEDITSIGVASHIYAASEGGPRGQGELSDAELADIGNAIWLCEDHARLVDANRGEKYLPSVLLGYRDLHEFRVSLELKDLPQLPGWIERIAVNGAPFGSSNLIRLGKTTVFHGPNGSGKTTVCQWIAGTFAAPMLRPWLANAQPFGIVIRMLLRDGPRTLEARSSRDSVVFAVEGIEVPYNPLDFRVVYLRSGDWSSLGSPIERLAGMLAIPSETVVALARIVPRNPGSALHEVRVEGEELLLSFADGGQFLLPYQGMSGGEKAVAAIEFAIALATTEANYRPTLLCIDAGIGALDARATEALVARLASPSHKFQTIVVTNEPGRFVGWQSYEFTPGPPVAIIPSYNS